MMLGAGIGRALIMIVGKQPGNGISAFIRFIGFGTPPMVIHLRPAVCTEYQPRERIGNAGLIRAMHRFSCLLRQLPGFWINDGLMGILQDHPILRICQRDLFALIGFLFVTEVHAVSHILDPGNDL